MLEDACALSTLVRQASVDGDGLGAFGSRLGMFAGASVIKVVAREPVSMYNSGA